MKILNNLPFKVGCTGELPESIDEIVSTSNNKQAVHKFRIYKTNCLVSTSVLEEGIDIQSVNLVIMYDYPETFRSYMQSKGRARSEKSDYLVFINRDAKAKFNRSYIMYQEIDSSLRKVIYSSLIKKKHFDQ